MTHQELDAEYGEKKQIYDSALVGIDSDVSALKHQIQQYRDDIKHDESQYHVLHSKLRVLDISQEKVMGEMKVF